MKVTAICSFIATILAVSPLMAAEIPEGTVVSASNIEQIKEDTFEGKKIGSMIPDKLEWMIKTHGLRFTLKKSPPVQLDPKYLEYSRKNASGVSFSPGTRQVVGWEAGMPFPNIDVSDPHAGDKVAWNIVLGTTAGSTLYIPARYLYIDTRKGLERNQLFDAVRTMAVGRLDGGPTAVNDGEFSRTMIYGKYPNDVKGIGTFSIRYTDVSKPEDTWAYLTSVRRTRRLSGGAWMDPIAGGDQLNDDFDIWDAEPVKYKSIKLLRKQWMLVPANLRARIDPSPSDRNPAIININQAPFSMPSEAVTVEPREVYVFEAITPDQHPYSKKVVYSDAQYPGTYFGEFYDRTGDLWKTYYSARRAVTGADGYKGVVPVAGFIVDYKRNHATVWIANSTINPADWTIQNNTLQRLEQMSR